MHVWIVEMWNPDKERWEPTTTAALTQADGRIEMKWWRMSNPDDLYRLRRYERSQDK